MQPDSLKSFVTDLLGKLGVEVDHVEVKTGQLPAGKAGRTVVAVSAADPKDLIGPGGEHLRSLNTIARRMVETAHGEEAASFLIDVNGHHEAQLESVRQNARMFAQRVRLFKHDVELPVMSPYERLVVHELFSQDPEVGTESVGEGKFRHIVLKYKNQPLATRA